MRRFSYRRGPASHSAENKGETRPFELVFLIARSRARAGIHDTSAIKVVSDNVLSVFDGSPQMRGLGCDVVDSSFYFHLFRPLVCVHVFSIHQHHVTNNL